MNIKKNPLPFLLSTILLIMLTACAAGGNSSGGNSSSGESTSYPENSAAMAVTSASDTGIPQTSGSAGEEKTKSFPGVTNLNVTGYLQHIEIGASDSGELVIRWTGDGSETVTQKGGIVTLSMAEPDWLDKTLPNDGSPRFSVTSTIYVELPDTIDTAAFSTTLGDITIHEVTAYNHLRAETILGNITTAGLVGGVYAETGRGSIGPDSFAADLIEQPYSTETNSKRLETTLPGGSNPPQKAKLYSESGIIMINEKPDDTP